MTRGSVVRRGRRGTAGRRANPATGVARTDEAAEADRCQRALIGPGRREERLMTEIGKGGNLRPSTQFSVANPWGAYWNALFPPSLVTPWITSSACRPALTLRAGYGISVNTCAAHTNPFTAPIRRAGRPSTPALSWTRCCG